MTNEDERVLYLDPLQPLVDSLGLKFNDQWLLRAALTHSSFCCDYTGQREMPNYERLELRGDAVIGLIVKDMLLDEFPRASEGDITRLCHDLVNNEHFARAAQHHNLPAYMLLSRAARDKDRVDQNPYIHACLLEALIGAIYLDQGLETARFYVDKLIMKDFRTLLKFDTRSPVVVLQSLVQASYKTDPYYEYTPVRRHGRAVGYAVVIWAKKHKLARGEGRSKKAAKCAAAQNALNLHFPNRRT